MTRLGATVWTAVVCGAVLSPIVQGFRDTPRDDFPLSWFPMFAGSFAVDSPLSGVAFACFFPLDVWVERAYELGRRTSSTFVSKRIESS